MTIRELQLQLASVMESVAALPGFSFPLPNWPRLGRLEA